jgi:hypothetical protein
MPGSHNSCIKHRTRCPYLYCASSFNVMRQVGGLKQKEATYAILLEQVHTTLLLHITEMFLLSTQNITRETTKMSHFL